LIASVQETLQLCCRCIRGAHQLALLRQALVLAADLPLFLAVLRADAFPGREFPHFPAIEDFLRRAGSLAASAQPPLAPPSPLCSKR
jgi:hypothetical protein